MPKKPFRRACQALSNHSGRNLDTVPATINALPRIAEQVNKRVPLLMLAMAITGRATLASLDWSVRQHGCLNKVVLEESIPTDQ